MKKIFAVIVWLFIAMVAVFWVLFFFTGVYTIFSFITEPARNGSWEKEPLIAQIYPPDTKMAEPRNREISVPEYLSKESFVLADLTTMTILMIDRENEVIKDFPILSIRPSGTYATPTGNFKALTKELKHFSTIGKVWMPYSVQFHGN